MKSYRISPKGMIIRFFYRRKPSLPYVCTATRRFSTLLHLFYLSPIRCVRNSDGFLHESVCFRFFVHENMLTVRRAAGLLVG